MQDKTAIINAAQKLASKGQLDKAIAEWEKLLVNNKDGNIHNTIGDLYLKKGSESDAIVSFTKAAEIFKKDGFYPKAIALHKKILNIVPNDVNSLISLGKLNADKGLIASAIDYYFKAAEIYHRDGSTENATTIVERILHLSPSDPETRKKIAYLYFRLGLRKRAANEYASIADDLLKKNDLEPVEELCNQAIEFDPENTQAYLCMSKLAASRDNPEKAFEYMEKAVSYEPDNKSLLLDYATLLIDNNKNDDAMPVLIKYIESHPSDYNARKMLGDIYLKEGLTKQAWNELLPCIENLIESEEWSSAQTLLSSFTEEFPLQVKQHLLTICKATGDNDAILTELKELAVLHEEADAFEDSLKSYKEILELSPNDSSSEQKIMELEIKLGIREPVAEIPSPPEPPQVDSLMQNFDTPTEPSVPASSNTSFVQPEPAALQTSESAPQPKPVVQQTNESAPHQDVSSPIEEPKPQPEVIRYEEVLSAPAEPDPDKLDPASEHPGMTTSGSLAEKKAEADFYAQQGLNNEAIAIYRELLSYDPENDEFNFKIRSLSEPAAAPIQQSEQKEVDIPVSTHEEPAAPASVDEDLQDIFEQFGKSEEEKVEDYEARYQSGLEFRQQGRLDDAIKELQIAVLDPDKMVRNSTMLAMCYMESGSYPLAILGFKKVLNLMSSSDSTYLHVKYELATAYLNNKDNRNAIDLFSEIHSQKPDFKDVSDKLNSLPPPTQDEKPKPKKDRVSYI